MTAYYWDNRARKAFIINQRSKTMKIRCTITLTAALLSLTPACAQHDPSLASGVQRKGGGIYSIVQFGPFNADMTSQAIQQCRMDGKNLDIVSSTTYQGITGTTFPMLVFKCK